MDSVFFSSSFFPSYYDFFLSHDPTKLNVGFCEQFFTIFFLNFEISCLKVATPTQFTPKILMKNAISMLYAFQTKKELSYHT